MAVFTHLIRTDIETLLDQYQIGQLQSFEGIAQGIDNTNYKIETSAGRYVLTIFEKRINPDDLPFFLEFMAHLSKNGITCPAPVIRTDGSKLSTIFDKKAAVFPFLSGHNTDPATITPELCHELGILLGKMHLAGEKFSMKRANSMGWDAWNERIIKAHEKSSPILGQQADLPQDELKHLKESWPKPHSLPAGAIHADLFPDNVFVLDGHIHGVIDFYFSATDFLAYDLAIVMNAWCFDTHNHFDTDRWAALLTGYESIRPLTQPEKESYQTLSRGAAMRFLSSRLYDLVFHDPNALVHPKPPAEYVEKLEFHRHAKLF